MLCTFHHDAVTTVLGLEEGKECIIVGTLYKHMKLKPSILDEYSKEVLWSSMMIFWFSYSCYAYFLSFSNAIFTCRGRQFLLQNLIISCILMTALF